MGLKILQFYRLQLLYHEKDDNYFVHTRWGRVGEFGQVKTMGPMDDLEDALKEYNKKFKDKSGNKWDDRSEPAKKGKYTFLERNYEDDEDEAEDQVKKEDADDDQADSKLPRQTQRLMELIFNQNHFNAVLESIGYNANKLPLGKLSKATLKQGFEHLHELASLIKHPILAQNKYGISQKEVSRSSSVCSNRKLPKSFCNFWQARCPRCNRSTSYLTGKTFNLLLDSSKNLYPRDLSSRWWSSYFLAACRSTRLIFL